MRILLMFLGLVVFGAAASGQCDLTTKVDPITKSKSVRTPRAKLQHGLKDKWETQAFRFNDAEEIGFSVVFDIFRPMPVFIVTPDDLLIFQTDDDSLYFGRPVSTSFSSYNPRNSVTTIVVMYTINLETAKELSKQKIIRMRLSATETNFDLELKSDKAHSKLVNQFSCIVQ